jgi:nucleotide-binding universal stress UspA family protein
MMEAEGSRRQHIVVGVDGSDSSRAALTWAIRQARLTGAAVDAVIAWHQPTVYRYPLPIAPQTSARELATRVLESTIYEVTQELDGQAAEVTPRVEEGNAATVLLDAAADADLLVVGSRGHGGFAAALLGSTSQHVVHHAACPVVVIRDGAGA